ncbi:MAG: hypothetical protein CMK59_14540 [Proteobacteria bacterium]|nr:hypothetical protein [Pseudomonadota bacterium]
MEEQKTRWVQPSYTHFFKGNLSKDSDIKKNVFLKETSLTVLSFFFIHPDFMGRAKLCSGEVHVQ